MKLYRSIVHKSKKLGFRLGKRFPVEFCGNVRQAVAKDVALDVSSKLIVESIEEGAILDQITAKKFKFVALAKGNEYRLRDVVYYFIKG
jgi:hypothetical protein